MQITQIEGTKSRKCRIYLNDEPAFLLYESEIRKYHLETGLDFSEELQQEIYSAVLLKRAKLRCMNILKRMDKTEAQLVRKLQEEEYPEELIREAVDYVKGYHYIDDARYAGQYIESRKATKSRQQITGELQSRGVAREIIELAWEETDPVDVTAQILYWAEKKQFCPQEADLKRQQKFYQFLLRKGFLFSDIKKALT